MNCRDAHRWLLEARDEPSLPPPVRYHLERCAECRRRWQVLQSVDAGVRSLPLPPADLAKKAALAGRLDRAVRVARPQRVLAQPALWPALRRGAWIGAVAASVLVVFGMAGIYSFSRLGHNSNGGQNARMAADFPSAAKTPPEPPPGQAVLVAKVLHLDARLAGSTRSEEQLPVYGAMAGDLKDEALRQAKGGNPQAVPGLVNLYERVVIQGLLKQAAALAAERRPATFPPLVTNLRAAQREAEAAARDALPAIADLLRPLGSVARDAADRLEQGRLADLPEPMAIPGGGQDTLLTSVVSQGLQMSEVTDPLRRADLCADMSGKVAQEIVLLTAGQRHDDADRLGQALSDLLDRGVAGNLEMGGGNPEQQEAIRQRSLAGVEVLQKNLDVAPAPARPGLEKAVEATRAAKEKIKAPPPGKAKGKGDHPPGHKN